jgi:hypothetical protein
VVNENWMLGGKGEVGQGKVLRAKAEEGNVKWEDMIRSQVIRQGIKNAGGAL